MRDDVSIFLVGAKSRLVWDELAGIYEICVAGTMAISVSSSSIRLTEEDINGASLQGRNAKDLSISELKRWLSCRKGAKLSGNKRSLAERQVSRGQTVIDIFQSRF